MKLHNEKDFLFETRHRTAKPYQKHHIVKLKHQKFREINVKTRGLVIVKGDQEIDRKYVEQHHDIRTILQALRKRIDALKASKIDSGLSTSLPTLRHLTNSRQLYLKPSSSLVTESEKKELLNASSTKVTDIKNSSPDATLQWSVFGTIHDYEPPKNIFKHKQKFPVPPSINLTSLPLYDDRVLQKATSGIKIFVKEPNDENIKDNYKHVNNSTEGNSPASVLSGLHDVYLSTDDVKSGLHADENSISVGDLFKVGSSKSLKKINRLLSDDGIVDTLAKKIAYLLSDELVNSPENQNDVRIVNEDRQENVSPPPVINITPVSSKAAVSFAQDTDPTSVSKMTQQCLAKRGLGSSDCSLSVICCSVCCPLG